MFILFNLFYAKVKIRMKCLQKVLKVRKEKFIQRRSDLFDSVEL